MVRLDGPAPPRTRRTRTSWWDQLSLRARLVIVVCGTVAAALVASGVASLPVLERVLLGQKDAQLRQVLERDLSDTLRARGDRPSPYYFLLVDDTGKIRIQSDSDPVGNVTPPLPQDVLDLEPRQGKAAGHAEDGSRGETHGWTVPAGSGPGEWRVMSTPGRFSPSGAGAVAYVGLPLDDVSRVLRGLAIGLLALATLLIPLAALLGGWAVQRALRPLRHVQEVTAAFAGGDTRRRVADASQTTEVGQLGASVNAMLDQIESELAARQAAQERMRRFVADASHELRTPLATLRGFAELYRMGALEDDQKVASTMRRIENESKRMATLVEDLLLLARMDEKRRARRLPVDVRGLVRDAHEDAHALAPHRPLTLHVSDQPVRVLADEGQLRQVVSNLMGNAIRHTPPGTPLECSVHQESGQAVIRIVDHGQGIPAEHKDRIFERFYRADASRARSSGGAGLGLSIVYAIVTAHGGTIRVTDTTGGGATFTVELPLDTGTNPHPPAGAGIHSQFS
ncbi:MAG: two-component sensor histidine kinase [Micrococcales bacterium]|nr:MAG: two-component sensor histidine kinase [Micrococcales bacterium]PIE26892.1 MAG: two-component sensor histidine kinase [Micrococcales bacterium]